MHRLTFTRPAPNAPLHWKCACGVSSPYFTNNLDAKLSADWHLISVAKKAA